MPEYTPDLSGFENAMATMEGFGVPGSLATVNNNPGNIQYGPFAIQNGAVGSNKGFAVFPSTDSGFSAMGNLLQSPSYSGLSVADAIAKWNGNGANSDSYTNFVTGKTGLSPTQPISSISSSGPSILDSTKAALTLMGNALGSVGVGGQGSGTNGITGPAKAAATVAAPAFGWLSHVSLSQVVSIFVGLGILFAGFFMLKPTQNILVSGTKSVAKLAA